MPVIDLVETGRNIKDLIFKNNYTVIKLADKMHMETTSSIYKWIRGDGLPTIDNLAILASVLGVTIDDILIIKIVEF